MDNPVANSPSCFRLGGEYLEPKWPNCFVSVVEGVVELGYLDVEVKLSGFMVKGGSGPEAKVAPWWE